MVHQDTEYVLMLPGIILCDYPEFQILLTYLNFREIDEALRPGVYALIDACSPDDLQQLHVVLRGWQSFNDLFKKNCMFDVLAGT